MVKLWEMVKACDGEKELLQFEFLVDGNIGKFGKKLDKAKATIQIPSEGAPFFDEGGSLKMPYNKDYLLFVVGFKKTKWDNVINKERKAKKNG